MSDTYLNKKPTAEDFAYAYVETSDGAIVRVPKKNIFALGKDGGYYKPTVDDDGNLTWVASAEGMPEVAGTNIKGPKGDKGDPGSDATVTAVNIKSALGYTPADTKEVSKLSQEIVDLQGDVLPSYYDDYLAEKIVTIKELLEEAGADASSFIYYGDSHDVSTQYASLIANKIMGECNINHLFFVGDAEKYSASDADDAKESMQRVLSSLKKGKNMIVTRGNHDGAHGTNDEYFIDKNQLYANYDIINHCKADAYGEDNTYCYVDDKAEKTRYIVLNTYDYPSDVSERPTDVFMGLRQTQYDWLINALNVYEDWNVIVLTHIPPIPVYYNSDGTLIESRTPLKHLAYLLGAFADKTTYSVFFGGVQGKASTGGYTNLFSTSGDGYATDTDFSGTSSGRTLSNIIEFDTVYEAVIHLKGATPYKYKVRYQTDSNPDNMAWSDATYCTNAPVPIAVSDYDSDVKVMTMSRGEYGVNAIQLEFRETIPEDMVITVDEDIIEASDGDAWDALNIDADFSSYKGKFIGLFTGHIHQDYRYLKSDGFGCDITTICCDARGLDSRSYNDATTYPEYGGRAIGTVYEQCLDVVIVNKATKEVKTVRIGAGDQHGNSITESANTEQNCNKYFTYS